MKSKDLKDLQSYRRVVAWGVANPHIIPPAEGDPAAWSPLTRQCQALAVITADISDAAALQELHATGGLLDATGERALRKHLRDELHVITQVAQTLRKEVPGIGTIKMPPHGLATERLLNSADALTRQASTYESVFIEHGLAPDFIAQVRRASSTIKASIDGRGSARATLTRATKSLTVNVALGRRYVRLMDAALTKNLRNDAAKLTEWKNAKRVVAVAAASTSDAAASMLGSTPQTASAPFTQPVAVVTSVAEVKAA